MQGVVPPSLGINLPNLRRVAFLWPEQRCYLRVTSWLEGSVSDAPDGGQGSGGFSLELGADLVQVRDWLPEFAVSVIRPAAAEWDEREETPWPVLEEAAM